MCNTVCYKTMWFFTTKTQFFERELFQNGYKQYLSLKKGDVNKRLSVHRTTLLLRWTKVLDLMLFRGSLPLELNRDLQQWMRLWLHKYYYYTNTQYYMKLVCTAFVLYMVWCYCLHKFSKCIPYKRSMEKQRCIVDAWGLDLQNDIVCQD